MNNIKKYINKRIEKIKEFKLSANTFTFLFFLMVSTVFWFFNALNKDYVDTIKVPVKFINFPENKMAASDFIKRLNVKIEASGYSFLKYTSTPIRPAVINMQLHSIYPVSEHDDKRFYLLSSTITNEIAARLDGNTVIKSIKPDSIIFVLNEVIKKKLPVVKKLNLNFRQQYMLKDSVKLIPDSVSVRGIKSVLDTVKAIYTKPVTLNDLHDSLSIDLDLEKIENLDIEPDKIKCLIPVEEFAEISFTLPIEVENLPENYRLKLFPSEAKVVCNVVFSQYRQVFPQQFKFTVNYRDISEHAEKLKVNLIKYPENVSAIRYYPIAVEYLLEEND